MPRIDQRPFDDRKSFNSWNLQALRFDELELQFEVIPFQNEDEDENEENEFILPSRPLDDNQALTIAPINNSGETKMFSKWKYSKVSLKTWKMVSFRF